MKRMCTVLWLSFRLTGLQKRVESLVRQPCPPFKYRPPPAPRTTSCPSICCCLYKCIQNSWSHELIFAELEAFCRRKTKAWPWFLFLFFFRSWSGFRIAFLIQLSFKNSLSLLLRGSSPFICNFRFLSPVSWDLQSSKISQFTLKMFWFLSQTLASVLSTEWLKAVCSVRTVTVFKQGSLCLFKRMGKWLSWQIRLKKTGQPQSSTDVHICHRAGFLGYPKQKWLVRRWPCPAWHLTTGVIRGRRPPVSLGRQMLPGWKFLSLFSCVIIKVMEHRRNFSKDPVQMPFHFLSHAGPAASLRSREEGEPKLRISTSVRLVQMGSRKTRWHLRGRRG